jgi:transposase-like protein
MIWCFYKGLAMKSTISSKCFHNEETAYAWVENLLWPEGPICPHCGGVDRIGKLAGKSTRIGVYKCYQCHKPFTVKVGTIFEDSHVPLRHWLQAMFLLASSKKGISANQLARTLGCTLKTGWFIGHRIREAMRDLGIASAPMGSGGGVVEADETYLGRKQGMPRVRGVQHKMAVVSLVERAGRVRSFKVDEVTKPEVEKIIRENVSKEARLMTDSHAIYRHGDFDVADHQMVDHEVEWRRGDAHTNTVESYYSVFKRGMKGTYQHCQEKHLHRYAAEFDFRHNNRIAVGVDDAARFANMVRGIVGKRLTYR